MNVLVQLQPPPDGRQVPWLRVSHARGAASPSAVRQAGPSIVVRVDVVFTLLTYVPSALKVMVPEMVSTVALSVVVHPVGEVPVTEPEMHSETKFHVPSMFPPHGVTCAHAGLAGVMLDALPPHEATASAAQTRAHPLMRLILNHRARSWNGSPAPAGSHLRPIRAPPHFLAVASEVPAKVAVPMECAIAAIRTTSRSELVVTPGSMGTLSA
jgi:hypothetical protein